MEEFEAQKIIEKEVGKHRLRWIDSPYANRIFAAIAFTESFFAPIIIDPFLVALVLARRHLWFRYTAIAIIFSVLGGLAGYLLGLLFYDLLGQRVIEFYGLTDYFIEVSKEINANAFAFVLLGALTPIPYKLVAIAAGVSQMNLLTFLVASIIGRILRLGAVGWATYLVGPKAVPLIRRHLLAIAYLIGVILILYIFIRISFPEFTQAIFSI